MRQPLASAMRALLWCPRYKGRCVQDRKTKDRKKRPTPCCGNYGEHFKPEPFLIPTLHPDPTPGRTAHSQRPIPVADPPQALRLRSMNSLRELRQEMRELYHKARALYEEHRKTTAEFERLKVQVEQLTKQQARIQPEPHPIAAGFDSRATFRSDNGRGERDHGGAENTKPTRV
jgi:hypothetical protein